MKCSECNGTDIEYTCLKCNVYYCSDKCSERHRENSNCKYLESKSRLFENLIDNDVVPEAKLQSLDNDETLKSLLKNPHLRKILRAMDSAANPEEFMQKAMQEVLFVEFSDACLQLLGEQRHLEESR